MKLRVLDNLSSSSLENLSQIIDEIESAKGECKEGNPAEIAIP